MAMLQLRDAFETQETCTQYNILKVRSALHACTHACTHACVPA